MSGARRFKYQNAHLRAVINLLAALTIQQTLLECIWKQSFLNQLRQSLLLFPSNASWYLTWFYRSKRSKRGNSQKREQIHIRGPYVTDVSAENDVSVTTKLVAFPIKRKLIFDMVLSQQKKQERQLTKAWTDPYPGTGDLMWQTTVPKMMSTHMHKHL
jgi:hypothetical protein